MSFGLQLLVVGVEETTVVKVEVVIDIFDSVGLELSFGWGARLRLSSGSEVVGIG